MSITTVALPNLTNPVEGVAVLEWSEGNFAAGVTAQQLETGTIDSWPIGSTWWMRQKYAPYPGRLVGVSLDCRAARTAGTLSVDFRVNGTPLSLVPQLDGTNTQRHYVTQSSEEALIGGDTFSAGDIITATFTTSASWTKSGNAAFNMQAFVVYLYS